MALPLNEFQLQVTALEQDIQHNYNLLAECQDLEQLEHQLKLLDTLTEELTKLAHQLAAALIELDEEQLATARELLLRLRSLLESNIEQAKSQREAAKMGVLKLRQTSAGAAAYQAVKKQR